MALQYHGDTKAFNKLIAEYEHKMSMAPISCDDKEVKTKDYWQAQINWLQERFPESKYRDVIGLCKVAKLEGEDGIKDQDYSLNAGRYVGVVIEDDGMSKEEFKVKMLGLHKEYTMISESVSNIEQKLHANINELFGE